MPRIAAAFSVAAFYCFSAASLSAQPSDVERVFSIDEAEQLASLNSATLLATEQDIIISQQRVQEARFQFFPDIGLQASGTRYDARYPFALAPEFRSVLLFPSDKDYIYSSRAYFAQSIYSGGYNMNVLHLAQSALKQAETRYEAVKMDTLFAAKRVFYQLILAQMRQQAASERAKTVEQMMNHEFTGWDRFEAEAIASGLRAKTAEAAQAVEMAKLDFRKELNLELDTPIRVTGTLQTKAVDIDLNRAIVWAMELRPELQSEIYKARMDDIAVSLAMGRRNPTLTLAGNYELTGQEFPLRQNNWDATLGLKIPFSLDFWTQLREKRAEKRQGEITRAELQDKVRLEVRQAYQQLQFWQDEWPRREKEFDQLKNLAQAVRGDARNLSALRAQAALFDALDRYLTAVKEHIVARAKLERAVGRPITN